MAVSIKDVADTLGLSKATVSCILSGQGRARRFSEETIKRVLDYADSINYQPNLLARGLSTGESKIIGLIIPYINDTFYAQITQVVGEEVARHGYMLTVCTSEGDGAREAALIKMLRAQQVEGVIVAPSQTSSVEMSKLGKTNYPFVLVDRYFPELSTNYVIVDNDRGSFKLVDKLIKTGRKRIAILTVDTQLFVMGKRMDGYRQALELNNIEYDPALCVQLVRKSYNLDIVTELDKLFANSPDVDGFYFSTQYLALEAIRYFVNKGIDFSKFAMGCFHTMTALDILAPQMKIALIPVEDMGREAVELLLKRIKNRNSMSVQGIILDVSVSE